MSYNMTFQDTSNTLDDIVSGVNTASGGMFAVILLVILWFILFSTFKRYETLTAYTASSFIVSVVAALAWFRGYVGFETALVPVIMLIVGVIIGFFKN